MKDPEVIYIYEHAARELDVACAVTALLRARHGVQAQVIHWPTGFYNLMGKVHPKLVVLPFCYFEETFRPLLAYWRKSIFFNLTWEQLFYAGNEKAKTPRGEFATRHVIHHAWSERYAAFLRSSGIAEENIFINGQPAYTLYQQPYRAYFASRRVLADRYDLDPAKKWIFFPENYNWAFYSELVRQRFVNQGQKASDIDIMREYCVRSLGDTLHWCDRIARSGKVELIIRPRPAISVDEFMEFTRHVLPTFSDNLHFLQSESVREWILASDLIISSRSTTLIEAAIAEKEFYLLEPSPMPEQLRMDWYQMVPAIRSEEEALQICLAERTSPADPRLAKWARNTLMSHGDSISNLAMQITRMLRGEVPTPPFVSQKDATPWVKIIPPAPIWALYHQFRRRLKHGLRNTIEPEYVKDVRSHDEIESRIDGWTQLLVK